MYFPLYFKRRIGATPAELAVLGSDTDPTVASSAKDASATNVLCTKVTGVGNPIQRLAVGYWYEGAGTAVTLPVKVFAFDRNSGKWYLASSGTLTNGQITYLKVPSLGDPPQTNANFSKPTAGGGEYLIDVADNTAPDGTYHLVAGPDTAQF